MTDTPDISIARKTMNGKPVFEIEVKTVLNFDSGFAHKQLCDIGTFSLGTACAFSCTYCYVEAMVRKHPAVARLLREIASRGLQFHDIVIVRANALDVLREQLTIKKPRQVNLQQLGVIFTSPLVDPAGNLPQARQTAEACRIVLELTAWDIRVLSKSNLLPELAKMIPEKFKGRVIYGVSTGTLENKVAGAIEVGTPLVSKRIASLHWLQDHGFRTFGMVCPSLPHAGYRDFAARMAEAIRVDRCEHVWAEVLNVRGDSMTRTMSALKQAGFDSEARRIENVLGPGRKLLWEQYARETFLAHADNIPPDKLRFLQYVTPQTAAWWAERQHQGAVLLGTAAGATRPSKNAE